MTTDPIADALLLTIAAGIIGLWTEFNRIRTNRHILARWFESMKPKAKRKRVY